jgi:hypothetical protein
MPTNRKVFTNESLATFVDETKLYVEDSVSELAVQVAYIDIEDNEDVSDENFADLNARIDKLSEEMASIYISDSELDELASSIL